MSFKPFLFTCLSAFLFSAAAAAQMPAMCHDMEGSSDYPLFPRLARFHIANYERNYDAVDVSLSSDTKGIVSGNRFLIQYELDEEAAPPSEEQVLDKYANLVLKKGGAVMFRGETADGYKIETLRLPQPPRREIWVIVLPYQDGQGYSLTVVEHDRFE
jgi:hypothetical protein